MSCAGDPNINTPNLDRLASEGVRFENAYSNTPLCSPFRASLYTGQYVHTHGVTSLHRPLVPSAPQLAEVLRQNGYYTSHMGKWHLSGGDVVQPYVSPYFRPGWDRWLGWEGSNRFFHTLYAEGDMPWKEDVDELALPGYQTDALTAMTIDFIRTYDREEPWFHVMSFEPPHSPNVAPEPYMDLFRQKDLRLRPNFDLEHERADFYQNALRGYYAQIKNLDDNIGNILACLEAAGVREKTEVWYFSDHGDYMGSHGRWQKGGAHEESSNVPLIVSQPSVIPMGQTTSGLISGVDFMPTLLGHLGIDIPSTCQGSDLSRLIREPERNGSDDVLIQFETPYFAANPSSIYRALRNGNWLYVFYLHHPGGEYELFNLETDPFQLTNLITSPDHGETRTMLNKRLRNKLDSVGDDFMRRYTGRA
jgi:arylsulfatase A-like enzyme